MKSAINTFIFLYGVVNCRNTIILPSCALSLTELHLSVVINVGGNVKVAVVTYLPELNHDHDQ